MLDGREGEALGGYSWPSHSELRDFRDGSESITGGADEKSLKVQTS